MVGRTAIFDIDGTLSDDSHRQHFRQQDLPDWDNYLAACSGDAPIWPTIRLLKVVYENYRVVLVSSRSEDMRAQTEAWLAHHEIAYESLQMRRSGDFRPDHEVKTEIITALRTAGHKIDFAVEDRPHLVALFKELGIFCFQVPGVGN